MKVVSNTTPLIYLAKIDRLSILKDTYKEVYVTSAVWADIVQPLLKARPIPEDLPMIMTARREGWLKLKDPETINTIKLRDDLISLGLGIGEASSIALANDKAAIDIAKIYGVETRWFTSMLHDALREGHIRDIDEYIRILDACILVKIHQSLIGLTNPVGIQILN
ncbi:MAG: hypothetical protein H3Z52_07515 [archaeon]|nr:hypothetical protein [archaeon]